MNADRASGALLCVFALAVAWEASKLPLGTLETPVSGFFPLSLAMILAALATISDSGNPIAAEARRLLAAER